MVRGVWGSINESIALSWLRGGGNNIQSLHLSILPLYDTASSFCLLATEYCTATHRLQICTPAKIPSPSISRTEIEQIFLVLFRSGEHRKRTPHLPTDGRTEALARSAASGPLEASRATLVLLTPSPPLLLSPAETPIFCAVSYDYSVRTAP